MKKLLLLIGLTLLCSSSLNASDRKLSDWTLSREGESRSYVATVPSTVAGVLAQNDYWGKDLCYSGNYFTVDKTIFDSAWTYSTSFDCSPRKGRFYTLCFDGLGYYADITLNGQVIASSDTTSGVFIMRKYDVTDLVAKKGNNLSVKLRRAQLGDLNVGYVDWNPRPLDESMGILRDVILRETGAVSIEDVFVKTDLDVNTLASAEVGIEITLRNCSSSRVKAIVKAAFEAGEVNEAVELEAFETKKVTASVHVDSPRVWWSHDLGKPELYSLDTKVLLGKKVSDSRSQSFGIRSITSCLYEGKYRQFVLNGKPVLIKGAGWTDEIFMRDTHESLARQVALVKDMGLNCIRFENIWGKDSFIYDECDREGVLVIAGFSCQWEWKDYCGLEETKGFGCINDPKSMDMAVKYFHDQVLWMRNHTSLIAWLTGSDRIPNKELEKRYMDIYDQYEYRPYICSAKGLKSEYGGLSGFKMEGPYEYVSPEYWYVDQKHGGAYGFNSETGIGANIPQKETLAKMMPADSLWPLSKSWNQHCTASASAMNTTDILMKEISGQYGEASDYESFVGRAHAVDYDGVRAMFEAFRVSAPKATGVIQWMLNSAWPSIYWQLYDYYLNPTAGYYGTKQACLPQQLIYNYSDNQVYGISDSGDATMKASVKVFDKDSKPVYVCTMDVQLGREAKSVFVLPEIKGGFIALSLMNSEGEKVADNFYAVPVEASEFDWKHSNWCYTPSLKSRDLHFVTVDNPAPSMTVVKTDAGYEVTLKNETDRVSYLNRLALIDKDGALVSPAFWSENFISLIPGETKKVCCKASAEGTVILNTLK